MEDGAKVRPVVITMREILDDADGSVVNTFFTYALEILTCACFKLLALKKTEQGM